MSRVIVTGGAGFIGSALVLRLLKEGATVLTVDKMTYAGNRASLREADRNPKHEFLMADICDQAAMTAAIVRFEPDVVLNLAAESHVDRSITSADPFVQTNVVGVASLLQAALKYYEGLSSPRRDTFRFLQVSTDEVFGSLGEEGAFNEWSNYAPNSPYSASKAGGDHLVRAWRQTYGLPTLITNCSNNYGPRQFPEKLIPLMIVSALHNQPLPVYGTGKNVRDWIHVEDHVDGIIAAATKGEPGERYLFGGGSEVRNVDIVKAICKQLGQIRPAACAGGYEALITFVEDRKGHDYRYAIDDVSTREKLGWRPRHTLETGLKNTIDWYLDNESWWRPLLHRTPLKHLQ